MLKRRGYPGHIFSSFFIARKLPGAVYMEIYHLQEIVIEKSLCLIVSNNRKLLNNNGCQYVDNDINYC